MNPASLLLVNNDPDFRQSAALLLRGKGYDVACAATAKEALEILHHTPVHLVLIDLCRPGTDGRDLCRRIKASPALQKIFVILLSGTRLSPEDQIAGFDAGADSSLTQPLPDALLLAHIEALLRIRHREQETLRGNLVHMVIHDLRSPLAALISSLDFLASSTSGKLSRAETTCLTNAVDGGTRLSGMINTLLDVSRLEAGKMPIVAAPEDLESLSRSVISSMEPLLGRRQLTCKNPGEPLRTLCDAAIVRRILTNLLDNAIRHTRPDGTIVLKIRRGADGALVSVTDDGPGIAPAFHQKVFEKFAQLGPQKKQTSGLGLAFCKLAVEAHGGRIGITSEPGYGCTFWFTLPDAPPLSIAKPGAADAPAMALP